MFFYLFLNSSILDNELDEHNKNIKVVLYGGISYIILHATLFIGGKDALLYNLKQYFWLFLILDCSILLLSHVSNNNGKINLKHPIFSFLHDVLNFNKRNTQETTINTQNNRNIPAGVTQPQSQNIKTNIKPNRRAPVKKEVSFDINMDYSSDSDSDIGTDIDFEAFKNSL
jgi:hypothetical protein